jgi:phosphatidylserine/phosphatidylglycerophosphate/cardiolipin synthase-like enzyme
VAELADAPDLGSGSERIRGSIPLARTNFSLILLGEFGRRRFCMTPARTRLYYWPLAKRERNQSSRPGKLHMKCAIVDNVALIGSANLTDDAFNRNMELGVLVREDATVENLSEHFRELIRTKILVPVVQSDSKYR